MIVPKKSISFEKIRENLMIRIISIFQQDTTQLTLLVLNEQNGVCPSYTKASVDRHCTNTPYNHAISEQILPQFYEKEEVL